MGVFVWNSVEWLGKEATKDPIKHCPIGTVDKKLYTLHG